ncbi:hypothetical protein H8356DRAFT_1337284 [Neocallimastix lanati (nom. inval.)]|nr:hypothetical protein H8356DRAFT_1337284 [Neocallimastix sp. JGI-2020a]
MIFILNKNLPSRYGNIEVVTTFYVFTKMNNKENTVIMMLVVIMIVKKKLSLCNSTNPTKTTRKATSTKRFQLLLYLNFLVRFSQILPNFQYYLTQLNNTSSLVKCVEFQNVAYKLNFNSETNRGKEQIIINKKYKYNFSKTKSASFDIKRKCTFNKISQEMSFICPEYNTIKSQKSRNENRQLLLDVKIFDEIPNESEYYKTKRNENFPTFYKLILTLQEEESLSCNDYKRRIRGKKQRRLGGTIEINGLIKDYKKKEILLEKKESNKNNKK